MRLPDEPFWIESTMCDTAGTFAPGKIYCCQSKPASFQEDTYVFAYETAEGFLVRPLTRILRVSLTHPLCNKPQTSTTERIISIFVPNADRKEYRPYQAWYWSGKRQLLSSHQATDPQFENTPPNSPSPHVQSFLY